MKIDDKPASEMTLREHFAGLAMSWLFAKDADGWSFDEDADIAVRAADALCRELAKPRPKPAWQPMSTAPLDRIVEVCFEGKRVFSCSFGRSGWLSHGQRIGGQAYAWRPIETDDHPEQLPTEPVA